MEDTECSVWDEVVKADCCQFFSVSYFLLSDETFTQLLEVFRKTSHGKWKVKKRKDISWQQRDQDQQDIQQPASDQDESWGPGCSYNYNVSKIDSLNIFMTYHLKSSFCLVRLKI